MKRLQIHRISVADQVAGFLRQQILAGEQRSGTALQEVPPSVSLGAARNTLPEAVRILSLESLLKRDIHRGVSVSHLSIPDVQEIYHFRPMWEIPAFFAANEPSNEILREMRTLADEYESSVQARDWVLAVNADLEFHTWLIRFSSEQQVGVLVPETDRRIAHGDSTGGPSP